MADDDLFIRIEVPDDLRRNLLESLRDSLKSLERFDKIKEIREQKTEQIQELRNQIREIKMLLSNLKREFPKTKLVGKAPVKKGKKIKAVIRPKKPGIKELEQQLDVIEGKLAKLG